MSRYTIFAVIAALCLTVSHATTVGQSLTSASFAAAPSQVFNAATGAADATAWGTSKVAYFGPGADNTTVVTYGVLYTSTQLTSLIARISNASLISNGTADNSLAAKIGSDGTYTTAITWTSGPQYAVGLGSLALAFVALDTATTPCSQVWLAVFSSSGALLVKKQVTSYVCTAACSATVTASSSYVNTVNKVFYENATYYVTYTSVKSSNAYVTANTACATSDTQQLFAYLNGVAATSTGDLKWTTPAIIFTGTAGTTTPSPSATVLSPTCYPGNSSVVNSTNFYCTIRSADTLPVTSYVPVVVATGVAGSAVAIATDTTSGTTYPQTNVAFTPAGVVYSEYQTGILINNLTQVLSAASTVTSSVNTLQLWNLTTGATAPTSGGTQLPLYTNTYASGAYGGAGITLGSGYALLTSYSSASGTINYNYGAFFANGTINGSAVNTVSSGAQSTGNWFADAKGALWFGAYTYDDAASNVLVAGYIGKNVASLYNAGSILASFFAFLSLMIAALFAF